MDKVDPIETIRELIAGSDGYVALSTLVGDSPSITDVHGGEGELSPEVIADNQLGEDFRALASNHGWPFTSLAQVAFVDNMPLLLISDMSDHTRNIVEDIRVSMLIDGTSGKNRMNTARVTLIGEVYPIDKETYRDEYLDQHRKAKTYFDFADFTMYSVEVLYARLNAGFGKAYWVSGDQIRSNDNG